MYVSLFIFSLSIDTTCCNYAEAVLETNGHLPVLRAETEQQLYFDLIPNGLSLSFLLPLALLILILEKVCFSEIKINKPKLTQPHPPIIYLSLNQPTFPPCP